MTLLIASASVAFAVARDQAALLFAAMLGLGAMSLRRGTPGDESDSRRRLGFWMLAAWLVGLLVLTPMYRPYARLMLPWWVAASLGVGGLVDTLAALSRREDQSIEERRKRDDRRCLLTVVGAVAIGLIGAAFSTDRTPADRSDLKRAVDEMRTRMLAEARDRAGSEDLAVYVYAEPAAFFHLSAGGLLAGPVGDLEFASPRSPRLPLPTFLVVGPHARRNSRFQEQWAARETRFRRIGEWEFRPSPLVLLDHYSPTEIRSRREPIGERLELYLLE